MITLVTIRMYREAEGRFDCSAMKLSSTGVIPNAHIAIIGFFSSDMGLRLVDKETTKKRVTNNMPIIGKPKRRKAERLA